MPEGDTIFRLARRLDTVLAGQIIRAAISPRAHAVRSLVGGEILGVSPVGKHTLIEIRLARGGERLLRVHLGMDGRWRLRARTERRVTLPDRLTVALSTGAHTAVCWKAMEVELGTRERLWSPRGSLGRLGPDILADSFLPASVVPRARAAGHTLVGELLLDQTVAAGIGNIYKCEALFVEGIWPWIHPDELDDSTLCDLYSAARTLMLANLDGGRRITTRDPGLPRLPSTRFFAYGRAGHACLRCASEVLQAPLGRYRRDTFWCPTCQARLAATGHPSA